VGFPNIVYPIGSKRRGMKHMSKKDASSVIINALKALIKLELDDNNPAYARNLFEALARVLEYKANFSSRWEEEDKGSLLPLETQFEKFYKGE
jgi:hypothetical protein